MTKFLLSVHVLAAIIAIGPVTVAASMFPAAFRRAAAALLPVGADTSGTGAGDIGAGDTGAGAGAGAGATVHVLHRICRVYAVIGLAVPVFGFATASSLGVLGDTWLIVSIVLTLLAAVVLGAVVLPRQEALLDQLDAGTPPTERGASARLAMFTGVFNLLWAVVTVLMIVRPGSTTGA
ncbi:hypothetical protein ACWGJ2_03035 [Streptomyces sp. NPDC054796]